MVTADFFSTVLISDLRRDIKQVRAHCVRVEETGDMSPLTSTIILTNHVAAL